MFVYGDDDINKSMYDVLYLFYMEIHVDTYRYIDILYIVRYQVGSHPQIRSNEEKKKKRMKRKREM